MAGSHPFTIRISVNGIKVNLLSAIEFISRSKDRHEIIMEFSFTVYILLGPSSPGSLQPPGIYPHEPAFA
jgi:hypothetical protein